MKIKEFIISILRKYGTLIISYLLFKSNLFDDFFSCIIIKVLSTLINELLIYLLKNSKIYHLILISLLG